MSMMELLQRGQLPRPVIRSLEHALQNVCPQGMNAAPFRLTMHTQHTIRSSAADGSTSDATATATASPDLDSSACAGSARDSRVISETLIGRSTSLSGSASPPITPPGLSLGSPGETLSFRITSRSVRPPRFSDSSIDAKVAFPIRSPPAAASSRQTSRRFLRLAGSIMEIWSRSVILPRRIAAASISSSNVRSRIPRRSNWALQEKSPKTLRDPAGAINLSSPAKGQRIEELLRRKRPLGGRHLLMRAGFCGILSERRLSG
ncbi:hypothetical protein AXF42_Ash020246 [Apostasia shenzhenica]|uniref:Uncharacterized protein n=1 Tax=Apostasia shenzhenica TaxID=1088818 RepID=A0A2I0AVS0_9ASPA|nr:hypothetical protein AXF42_Ash020246 [Apostasia shenzhenica]